MLIMLKKFLAKIINILTSALTFSKNILFFIGSTSKNTTIEFGIFLKKTFQNNKIKTIAYKCRSIKDSIINWLKIAFSLNIKIIYGSTAWLSMKIIQPIIAVTSWSTTYFFDHLFTKKEFLKKGLIILKPEQLKERFKASYLWTIISSLKNQALNLIKMCSNLLLNFLNNKFIAIALTIAVFLISIIKQTQYFNKTINNIANECNLNTKQELHPFSSKINVFLSLNELTHEQKSTNACGTVTFDFKTGTECLDLLKKFEFQKTISYSKQHYMTTHNLVTTSAIFDFLTKNKPVMLTKYFPQQIFQLNITMINKSLFSEEADFIVGKDSIKINDEVKQENNIFASQSISKKAELLSNTKNSNSCPQIIFSFFSENNQSTKALPIVLMFIFLITICGLAILENYRNRLILSSIGLTSFLILSAVPYLFIPFCALEFWFQFIIWQSIILLIAQCFAMIKNISTKIACSSIFIFGLFSQLLFWFYWI